MRGFGIQPLGIKRSLDGKTAGEKAKDLRRSESVSTRYGQKSAEPQFLNVANWEPSAEGEHIKITCDSQLLPFQAVEGLIVSRTPQ